MRRTLISRRKASPRHPQQASHRANGAAAPHAPPPSHAQSPPGAARALWPPIDAALACSELGWAARAPLGKVCRKRNFRKNCEFLKISRKLRVEHLCSETVTRAKVSRDLGENYRNFRARFGRPSGETLVLGKEAESAPSPSGTSCECEIQGTRVTLGLLTGSPPICTAGCGPRSSVMSVRLSSLKH